MKKYLLFFMLAFVACFMGARADELTVADGTSTTNYLPVKGTYCDTEGTYGYMIYHQDSIAEMAGGEISKLAFYTDAISEKDAGCVLQLSLKEIENAAIASTSTTYDELTVCGTYTIVGGEENITFIFDTPFVYSGDMNLLVEVRVITASSNYADLKTYGVSQTAGTNTGLSHYSTYGQMVNFVPKITFEYSSELKDWDAKVTPTNINFGKVYNGEDATINVTLKNRGLNAFTPAISTLEAPFSTTYEAAELASEEEVIIPIKFAPTTDGNYTGTLTINCGEAGTFNVTLNGTSAEMGSEVTVCDGTNTNSYIPVYGSYVDTENTQSQFIYPAETLAELNGRKLTSVTFYPQNKLSFSGGKIQLSVKEVEQSAFEYETATSLPNNIITEMTVVGTVVPGANDTEMKFVFDEPFAYNGGNLAFETLVVETGSYSSCSFLGVNQTTDNAFCSYYSWSGSQNITQQKFLPKMFVESIANNDPVVDEDKVINFTAEQVCGTIEVSLADGTVVESGVTQVAQGETVTVVAKAIGNYRITGFEVKAGDTVLTLDEVDNDNTINTPSPKAETGNIEETHTFTMPAEDVTINVTFEIPTGIESINAQNVKSIRYYNAAGVESTTPFQGVNIVVREMPDGSKVVTKIVK